MHGIVVFNDLVLGGVLFSMIAGLAKYIIERSKMSEIRNETWGRSVATGMINKTDLPSMSVSPT